MKCIASLEISITGFEQPCRLKGVDCLERNFSSHVIAHDGVLPFIIGLPAPDDSIFPRAKSCQRKVGVLLGCWHKGFDQAVTWHAASRPISWLCQRWIAAKTHKIDTRLSLPKDLLKKINICDVDRFFGFIGFCRSIRIRARNYFITENDIVMIVWAGHFATPCSSLMRSSSRIRVAPPTLISLIWPAAFMR